MEKKIGVSYASKNREQLNQIGTILSSLGIKVIRYDEILKVKDGIHQFMDTLTDMDMNLLLLSKEYFHSPFCLYELAMLVKKPDRLVVIYLEEAIHIEDLLEDVRIGMVIQYDNQLAWLKQALEKIEFEDVINSLSGILNEKYLTFGEIISSNGIRQLLVCLNYTPDSYLSELDRILEKQDFYEREKSFVEYLEFAPANEIYNYYKALSYEKQEYIQGAIFFLKQAIDLNSTYIMAYIKLLDLSLRYPEKVSFREELFAYLEKISLSLQDRITVWKAKGMFLFRKAKQENLSNKTKIMRQALECFKQAAKLSDDQDAMAYNNMGQVYEVLEEVDFAANAYLKAIELCPQYYQALNNLALLYDKYFGEIEISRQLYERCLCINPNYAVAQSNYALLMEKVDINIAMEMDLRMLCEPHKQTDYITNLALIFEEEGVSKDLAGILYKIILEKKPQSLSAKFNMGNFLRRNGGAYGEVHKFLKQVNEAIPCNDMVLLSIALLEMREEHIEEALAYCNEAIQINGKYIPAYFLKGYLEEKKGIDRRAIIDEIKSVINNLEKYQGIERERYALLYNFLSILFFKVGDMQQANDWHILAFSLNSGFKKELDQTNPYYGIDILEYEYTHFSTGRIYKNRIENLMLDSHKEALFHLLELLN